MTLIYENYGVGAERYNRIVGRQHLYTALPPFSSLTEILQQFGHLLLVSMTGPIPSGLFCLSC